MLELHVSQLRRLVPWLVLCGALSGCAARIDAMTQTVKTLYRGNADVVANAKLNPSIRYLRVAFEDQVALLALGYIDSHPLGPIEVWYSARGDVLRLQNGHIVGLTGADVEWRTVRLSAMPVWPAEATAVTRFTRTRDVMPGYRFGIEDTLDVRAIAPPTNSRLQGLSATDLRWYEAREASSALPPARYAVRVAANAATPNAFSTVAYGEQCISPSLCLSWQQWPPASAP